MKINPTKLLLGLVGPFIAAGSAWLAGAAGKYGIHLDASGINTLATTGAVAGSAIAVKLIHDVEKKDPRLAAEVNAVVGDAGKAVDVAVKVDPQLSQAGAQLESKAVSEANTLASDVFPTTPAAPPVTIVPNP